MIPSQSSVFSLPFSAGQPQAPPGSLTAGRGLRAVDCGRWTSRCRLALLLSLFLLSAPALTAQESGAAARLEQANEAYRAHRYREAIDGYEALLRAGYRSAALYYNLGNSYYRAGEAGRAVLNYQRARRLAPRDADVLHNLEVVRRQLPDDLEPLPSFFLLRWWRGLSQQLSSDGWGIAALVLLWGGVGGLALWRLGATRRRRQWGFFAGLGLLLLSLLPFGLAVSRLAQLSGGDLAVILQPEVVLHSAPEGESQAVRTLHAGTTVELLDVISDWHKVRLPNGEQGWLPPQSFERV